jgi:hypothetical protein
MTSLVKINNNIMGCLGVLGPPTANKGTSIGALMDVEILYMFKY